MTPTIPDEAMEAALAAFDDTYEAEYLYGGTTDNKEAALRAALTAAAPMMVGWRKIEGEPDTTKAPWDGGEVTLGAPGWVESGFWHDGSENYWKQAGWYAEMDRGRLLTAKNQAPTHWQPLPSAPRDAGLAEVENG